MTIKVLARQKFAPQDMINVGEITGAHGIKGQVKVAALTDFPETRFVKGAELYLEKQRRTVEVLASSQHKGLYLLTLSGIEDRDTAQSLLHTYLQVSRDSLPELPEGEYYHFQLIGLSVYEDDVLLGTITEIMQTGANDVYIIEGAKDAKYPEILLPALKSCILKVDIATGRMDVKIPEGLLD